MHRYRIFGGHLDSDVAFPELAPAPDTASASWVVGRVSDVAVPHGAIRLGALHNQPCRTELLRDSESGYYFTHSCTGTFHIPEDDPAIRFAMAEGAALDRVRGDILGRVLAVALHTCGVLSLHASAVALRDGVIGFVAPKGSGKSTLAMALARAGAHLVSDDILAVWPSPRPVQVAPGVHGVRLNRDSAERLLELGTPTRDGVDGKRLVDSPRVSRIGAERAPLSAVYAISPTIGIENGRAARRVSLSPRHAALELLKHAKIGELLGVREAPVLLERAADVAQHVPIFALEIARDFDRLPEAVETIVEWHDGLETRAP